MLSDTATQHQPMEKSPNLYELLSLHPSADANLIKQACEGKLLEIERNPHGMAAASLAMHKQMVLIARDTLIHPASRTTYDAQLSKAQHESAAMNAGFQSSQQTHSDIPMPSGLMLDPFHSKSTPQDSVNMRADALALRAEALALRADAMVMKARANSFESDDPEFSNIWMKLLTGGAFWRILIFFALMGAIALSFSKCAAVVPQGYTTDNKAAEKAAMQEYFQTHGVRPANMAELELLEIERKRRENGQRSEKQDSEQQVRKEREFEEESRQRAKEVAEQLRREEAEHKENLRRIEQEEKEAARIRYERREAEKQAEDRRLEKMQQHWQDVIRR